MTREEMYAWAENWINTQKPIRSDHPTPSSKYDLVRTLVEMLTAFQDELTAKSTGKVQTYD